jgi:DNA-binding response OmpR family regulator
MLKTMDTGSVLIIEDDENVREMYADAFGNSGFKVFQAKDGGEGVRRALEHHPDVILVDILMPVMNGHEVVKEVRKDDWGKDAKIIYLTNLSDPIDVVHAIEKGAEEYIVKANTDIKEVINKVRAVMYS